jgi:hypothetical protein
MAAGIGVAVVFGAAGTANAAPAVCASSPQVCSNLTHHQQKQLDKIVKKSQGQQNTRVAPVK